ncbi:hypothetical protein BH23CHL2_BH23CHL2_16160 [soil metagenome]
MPDEARDLELSNMLASALKARGWTCATAESCSAGLVGHIITMIAGSSDYYQGGVIAYSNRAKEELLGVRSETLSAVGAVSPETAGEMASGARRALHADVGIATTGIAGPGGATDRKPVGLIYVAVALPAGETVRELRLDGDRLENIVQSAVQALQLAIDEISANDDM